MKSKVFPIYKEYNNLKAMTADEPIIPVGSYLKVVCDKCDDSGNHNTHEFTYMKTKKGVELVQNYNKTKDKLHYTNYGLSEKVQLMDNKTITTMENIIFYMWKFQVKDTEEFVRLENVQKVTITHAWDDSQRIELHSYLLLGDANGDYSVNTQFADMIEQQKYTGYGESHAMVKTSHEDFPELNLVTTYKNMKFDCQFIDEGIPNRKQIVLRIEAPA